MIANEAHIWTVMQATGAVSDEERAIVQLTHKTVEGRIKAHLGYDPEFQTHSNHYYPRQEVKQTIGARSVWDVNAAHTHAQLETLSNRRGTLQLQHIPLRSVTKLEVDENGRFGQGSSAFPSGSEWTEGEDFWGLYEMDGYCRSGLLHARGHFPFAPGSIRITYTAGYYISELMGIAGPDDNPVQEDASPILAAVVKSCLANVSKFKAWKKNTRTGIAGPYKSEKAQDYSYTLSDAQIKQLSMMVTIPAEAIQDLEPFLHMGRWRT